MADPVYKHLDLTGTSSDSIEDAVENAVRRASKTIRDMKWFEVVETRGSIVDGRVARWQVTVRIGFNLED
ncbi:MAG: dodecin family protein [Thermoanaerobaculia bacterium]|nr:dodecin family protein [Thermoanaerobaculia bacterium]